MLDAYCIWCVELLQQKWRVRLTRTFASTSTALPQSRSERNVKSLILTCSSSSVTDTRYSKQAFLISKLPWQTSHVGGKVSTCPSYLFGVAKTRVDVLMRWPEIFWSSLHLSSHFFIVLVTQIRRTDSKLQMASHSIHSLSKSWSFPDLNCCYMCSSTRQMRSDSR